LVSSNLGSRKSLLQTIFGSILVLVALYMLYDNISILIH